MHLLSIGLAVLLCYVLPGAWARSISVTLNLSLDPSRNDHSKLSADMVQSCMKSTELAMNELNRYRMRLMSTTTPSDLTASDEDITPDMNDDETNNRDNDVDYEINSPVIYNEKNQESMQCFAHCLYEQMGVIKDGIFVESQIMRKLYAIMEREQTQIPECMNLESANKCEAAYKMHLCYRKLKLLDTSNIEDTFRRVRLEMFDKGEEKLAQYMKRNEIQST